MEFHSILISTHTYLFSYLLSLSSAHQCRKKLTGRRILVSFLQFQTQQPFIPHSPPSHLLSPFTNLATPRNSTSDWTKRTTVSKGELLNVSLAIYSSLLQVTAGTIRVQAVSDLICYFNCDSILYSSWISSAQKCHEVASSITGCNFSKYLFTKIHIRSWLLIFVLEHSKQIRKPQRSFYLHSNVLLVRPI